MYDLKTKKITSYKSCGENFIFSVLQVQTKDTSTTIDLSTLRWLKPKLLASTKM